MQNSVWFSRQIAVIRKGKRRVTRMVVVVVLAFAICWLPIQVSPLRTGNYYYSAWSDFFLLSRTLSKVTNVKWKKTHTQFNIQKHCSAVRHTTISHTTIWVVWRHTIPWVYDYSSVLEHLYTLIHTAFEYLNTLEWFIIICFSLNFLKLQGEASECQICAESYPFSTTSWLYSICI